MKIQRLLIANRAEIACRIIATAQNMGIHTIAVFSQSERNARHVRLADESVFIGPTEATQSYLNQKAVLDAALATNADAIHPGYGFLSENPDFADAVRKIGLIFVGPPAQAVREMGLKDRAKQLMADAGVPVVPGYNGAEQKPDVLAAKAAEIGFPVLIKARAGGGGKGMRRVDHAKDFADNLDSAVREATAAFGDGHVIIEKYITAPRHIEIQLLSDSHGTHLHLFERDCSVQRRHQKIIEEAPAPDMPENVRLAMTTAAVTAAKTIGYEGAGTVEFIADGSGPLRCGGFWFMEMNTRLQVEHPVTEQVTGLDLVAWQLRIAAGERLEMTQKDITLTGHAIEARIYAEDPAQEFLPNPGKITHFAFPEMTGMRVDTGFEAGDEVSAHYDPMIAKLIVTGANRDEALDYLTTALGQICLLGVNNNLAFLARLCRHETFRSAQMTTGFLDQHLEELVQPETLPDAILAAACYSLIPSDLQLRGWRQWDMGQLPILLQTPSGMMRCHLFVDGTHDVILEVNDRRTKFSFQEVLDQPMMGWKLRWPEGCAKLSCVRYGQTIWISDGQTNWTFSTLDSTKEDSQVVLDGDICAPMSATVSQISVKVGQRVVAGDRLVVLEAMKMEQPVQAPFDGCIENIEIKVGESVSAGQILCRLNNDNEKPLS